MNTELRLMCSVLGYEFCHIYVTLGIYSHYGVASVWRTACGRTVRGMSNVQQKPRLSLSPLIFISIACRIIVWACLCKSDLNKHDLREQQNQVRCIHNRLAKLNHHHHILYTWRLFDNDATWDSATHSTRNIHTHLHSLCHIYIVKSLQMRVPSNTRHNADQTIVYNKSRIYCVWHTYFAIYTKRPNNGGVWSLSGYFYSPYRIPHRLSLNKFQFTFHFTKCVHAVRTLYIQLNRKHTTFYYIYIYTLVPNIDLISITNIAFECVHRIANIILLCMKHLTENMRCLGWHSFMMIIVLLLLLTKLFVSAPEV